MTLEVESNRDMDAEPSKRAPDVSARRRRGARKPQSARSSEVAQDKPEGEVGLAGLGIADILDAAPFYVMLIDEDHCIIMANRAVQTELGLEPEAIVGGYCPKVIHGLDKPWDACPLEESVQTGQGVEREALDQQSGRWIRSAVYPTRIRTPYGKTIFLHMISDITELKQAEKRLRASQHQLRELAGFMESLREEERTNLAREMHDELGSLLTGLKIDLSWLTRRIPSEQGLLSAKTASMGELVDEAIRSVKRISTDLRPGVLDDLGLTAALEWQTEELAKRTETRIEFKSSPDDIVLGRDLSTAIFRICQEALTNVARHAGATRIRVSLRKGRDKIQLRISDNGKGIEGTRISDPRSFGLIGMRERARSWGGEVKISGSLGRGTVVAVTIPLVRGGNPDA
jgi:PAS domain S-box-containing protein